MRIVIAAVLLAAAACSGTPAQADPYRWCAVYSGGRGGGSNCYFVTIEQCRATVSGVGGFCAPNTFYDGRPVTTPDDRPRRRAQPR